MTGLGGHVGVGWEIPAFAGMTRQVGGADHGLDALEQMGLVEPHHVERHLADQRWPLTSTICTTSSVRDVYAMAP